jgi:predicted Holliday junction resolvase-like endonuclease
MNLAKDAREIIHMLETNGLYAECPCCGKPMLLKESGLFYLEDFTPQAEQLCQQRLVDLEERKKQIRARREKISQTSETGARATNIGFILERLAPSMDEFRFDHNDCRGLFDPIDYIIFEGLSRKGKVSKIVFVDIKTGEGRLTPKQKAIRLLVERQRVTFDTYRMEPER